MAHDAPFFSVCIPTYNRPNSLRVAINSVLSQTYNNFELLVHDNSEDPTSEHVVNEFRDSRIKYKRHSENLGMLGNWNSLISAASGSYLKFLNDDDELLPTCLERFSDSIAKFGEYATFTCRGIYSKNGTAVKEDGVSGPSKSFAYDSLVGAFKSKQLNYRTPTHTAFKRDIAIRCGGFTSDVYYSLDIYSFHRFSVEGGAVFINEFPLVCFNLHGDQAGSKVSIKDRIQDLSAYIQSVLPDSDAELECNLGGMCLKESILMVRARRYREGAYAFREFLRYPFYASAKNFVSMYL